MRIAIRASVRSGIGTISALGRLIGVGTLNGAGIAGIASAVSAVSAISAVSAVVIVIGERGEVLDALRGEAVEVRLLSLSRVVRIDHA